MSTPKIRAWADGSSTGGATVAARIERELAIEILRGDRAPGSQLPSVRTLARDQGVTPPTIQRAVDRLELAGLVTVRRGSGVRVNDPADCGDLSLLPVWFEAYVDQPDRAAAVLGDFLELRRVVAAHLIRTRSRLMVAAAPELARLTARLADATELAEIVEIDLAFTRVVVEAADQFAVTSIVGTTERLVQRVPFVAEALYEDRAYHRRVIRKLLTAFGSGQGADAAANALLKALESWDRRTVNRFRELVTRACA